MPNLLAQTTNGAGETIAETAVQSKNALVQTFHNVQEQVVLWLPKAIAAVLILVVGYIVARLVAKGIAALTAKLGLQKAAERGGLVEPMQQMGIKRTVPQIVGVIFFWVLMCVFLVAAFDVLGLKDVTFALSQVAAYLPNLFIATIVVVLGLLLATFVRGLVATGAERMGLTYAKQLGTACYWLIAMMTAIAAFEQLRIEFGLLNYAILIAFGAVALGIGLSFGLGGRDVMAGILAGYYVRQRLQAGDQVNVAGYEGTVREVGPVATIIETEEDGLVHRHSIPNTKMLNEAVR